MLHVIQSELFKSDSPSGLAAAIAEWLNSQREIKLYRMGTITENNLTEYFFTVEYGNGEGDPVGIKISYTEGDDPEIKILAIVRVYPGDNGTIHYTPAADIDKDEEANIPISLACGKTIVEEGNKIKTLQTKYCMKVWYADTGYEDKDTGQIIYTGCIVGLYNGENYMKYPAYIGWHVESDPKGPELAYALQLNGGAYPQSGDGAHTGHSASNYRMSVGKTLLRKEKYDEGENIGKFKVAADRTVKNLFLQHCQSKGENAEASGQDSDDSQYTVSYSPLFCTVSNANGKLFQVDGFYCGAFRPANCPPTLQRIHSAGRDFVTLTDDGVAIAIAPEPPKPPEESETK